MIEIANVILYTPEDIEYKLDINSRVQARYRNNGTLPFRKMGSSIFYTQSDIRDFLENTKISSGAVKSIENIKDAQDQNDEHNNGKETAPKEEYAIKDEIIESIPDQQNTSDENSISEIKECSSDIKSDTATVKPQLNPTVATINLNSSYLTHDMKGATRGMAKAEDVDIKTEHVALSSNNAQSMQYKERLNSFKDLADVKP